MTLKSLIVLLGLGAAFASPVLGASHKTEGRITSELTFSSIDRDDKGYIHQGDLETFRQAVFAGMDTNEDRNVNYDEFRAWDPGFSYLADKQQKMSAYEVAIHIVFALWDRNGDGEISIPEMRHAMDVDFRRADINNDAIVSEAEFLKGFTIIVAIKAAFQPKP